VINLRLN